MVMYTLHMSVMCFKKLIGKASVISRPGKALKSMTINYLLFSISLF